MALTIRQTLIAAMTGALLCSPPSIAVGDPGRGEILEPRASGGYVISVPQCRIRLIDDVQLSCERTGILEYVAPEGTDVETNAVVANIRDEVVRASLAVADKEASNDIEVRFAQKATELAQLKYLRAVEANNTSAGAVPELELRELRLQAEKSLLQLEQAKQQFVLAGLRRDEIRAQVNSYQVRAPIPATVLNVHKQPGEVVREGETILELANPRQVRIEGNMNVDDIGRVRKGSQVEVRVHPLGSESSGPERSLRGQLAFVGLKAEPVSRTVRVWAVVDNRDNLLRDGLTVTLHVLTDTSPPPAARESSRANSAANAFDDYRN